MTAAPYTLADLCRLGSDHEGWIDRDRLRATVERLDSCEAQVTALQQAAIAHHAACPLFHPRTEPCGADDCACCREMEAQAKARNVALAAASGATLELRATQADLLEAVTLLSALWRAVPGSEPVDLVERIERALGAR